MDIVFEVSIESILNIFYICLKNRNNYVFSNVASLIKKDFDNSFYVLLNDYQLDLLNLNFLKSAKSHKLVYNEKYNAFIKDMKIKNNHFLIISIVNMDCIHTYLLFNKKYVSLNFRKFLYETTYLDTNILKHNKYSNIPIEARARNIIRHRNNKSFIHREKDKKIKLRNTLNKKYNYLNNNERLLLNKIDKKERSFNNESYMTFMESLEAMEQELESLEQELDFIDDINEYYEVIDKIDLLKYDIKEKENILKKDIKENQFYSNINY